MRPRSSFQWTEPGTRATVRAQRTEDVAAAGATMLLANTWHLVGRPGLDVLQKIGGLRTFMNWDGGILTDSGGFQAFSLGEHARVDDTGLSLRDPRSGRDLCLTPQSVVNAQRQIGSDIGMVLDHCVASTADFSVSRAAMERTHRWARASLDARGDVDLGLFGIVQGACHRELRRQSAQTLAELPFDGLAIGGLAVGETKSEREDMTERVTEHLPTDRPRYLMGVGTPLDLLEAVHRGVDLFDCILPTALAQHGRVYTSSGRLELRRAVYRTDETGLDPRCGCPACQRYSRAYLHHLFRAEEPLAWTLLGLHNLQFWLDLMARIRKALDQGNFIALYQQERAVLGQPDPEYPVTPPTARHRKRPPTQLGRWALHQAPAFGDQPPFTAIRDLESGEVMHSVSAPDAEARRLYVEGPKISERASESGPPLVVWDVGLGAGTNAIEIVRAWEAVGGERALLLYSFERDLDALRLACANHEAFPRLRHGGPAGILERGGWSRGSIRWELLHGDFRERLADAAAPDLVIYDPFPTRVDGPLWSTAMFRRIREVCGERSTSLHTYSRATGVRAALLDAGWFVGPGPATGPKSETTIAWTRPDLGPLLGRDFLAKWQISSAPWPPDLDPDDRAAFSARLSAHPQWARIGPSPLR